MGFTSGDSAEVKRWIIFGVWIAVNALVFGLYYNMYEQQARFEYMRELLGASFPVTRAAAANIMMCMAFILLPVCRNLISMLRTVSPQSMRQIYDADIRAHKMVRIRSLF